MKKLFTLLLAAGLICSMNSKASAVDVEMEGTYNFQFSQYKNHDKIDGAKSDAETQFVQIGMTFTASENLSGYVQLHSKWEWGLDSDDTEEGNGGLGNYPNTFMRQAYIDWTVPGTAVKVRMGRQELALPEIAMGGNPVLWSSDPSDGIALSADVTDWLSLAGFWTRYDHNRGLTTSKIAHTADIFALVADFKFEGFQFTPWLAFAAQDGNTVTGASGNETNNGLTPGASPIVTVRDGTATDSQGGNYGNNTFWFGINGEMSLFDPINVKADFLYGDRNFRSHTGLPNQHGWYMDAAISYKLDFGTPELSAWYGSGDDRNVTYAYQENAPTMLGRFGASYGFFNGTGLEDNCLNDGHTGFGSWGVKLAMKDISFLEGLSHEIGVLYASGSNSNVNANFGLKPWQYMTHKDNIVEFDFGTTYEIYKNLSAYLEVAYVLENFETHRDTNAYQYRDHSYNDAWKVALQLTYEF